MRRFVSALAPLRDAGRLATLLFQYPPWFHPRKDTRAELEQLPERLEGLPAMVEFRSPRWTATPRDRERTLALLDHLLMNNCYRDYAVRNAARLIELIGSE
ncbi:MAG: DUF72 domain-containing protein [Actinomycetota bacterium]|nr:DUF72 domain-containing protein [Actinomycetota bacterium]